MRSAGSPVTLRPLKEMVPRRGFSSPEIARKMVDLPAPFGPMIVTISPSSTVRDTSRVTWTTP